MSVRSIEDGEYVPNKKVNEDKLIHPECLELLHVRNHEEEKSARLYEDMYMFLETLGYTGAASLWHKYAHEEMDHADWARGYMMSLGIQPELREMPKLKGKYSGLADVIKKSLEHEKEITKQCNELAKCAMDNCDFMLLTLASKYLREQVEEIGKLQNWVDKLNVFGESKEALRFLDNEMGSTL